jgi:transposase-like protein
LLIAAAPDLLEALNRVMSWIDNWSPEFTNDEEWPQDRDAARAAIAKATGEKI